MFVGKLLKPEGKTCSKLQKRRLCQTLQPISSGEQVLLSAKSATISRHHSKPGRLKQTKGENHFVKRQFSETTKISEKTKIFVKVKKSEDDPLKKKGKVAGKLEMFETPGLREKVTSGSNTDENVTSKSSRNTLQICHNQMGSSVDVSSVCSDYLVPKNINVNKNERKLKSILDIFEPNQQGCGTKHDKCQDVKVDIDLDLGHSDSTSRNKHHVYTKVNKTESRGGHYEMVVMDTYSNIESSEKSNYWANSKEQKINIKTKCEQFDQKN